MKKTIHLGICMILMFLYIYLTPLGAITLARTFGLGMDSYIIFLVGEVLLIFFFIRFVVEKEEDALYLREKGLALVLSRFLGGLFPYLFFFKWI